MQCASSTTTRLTGQPETMPRSQPSSRSGRRYRSSTSPRRNAAMRSRRSSNGSDELTVVARKPSRTIASTRAFLSGGGGGGSGREPGGAAEAEPHERVDLVLHERDERRDHEYGAGQDLGRNLERERLAGTGGHDADAVATGEPRVDDAPLPGAELAIAEDGLEHLLRVGVARGVEQRGAGVEHEVFPVRVRVEGPDYSPGSGVTVGSPRSVQPRQPPSSETTFV